MIYTLVLLASVVQAQIGAYSALAVLQPKIGEVINAGDFFELKWKPSSAIPAVNLVLKAGGQADLETVAIIAKDLPNTGSYMWDVPRSLKTSKALSLMVSDSRDSSIANFSPYFTILEVGRGITKVVSTTKNRPTETIYINIKEHRATRVTTPTSENLSSPLSPSVFSAAFPSKMSGASSETHAPQTSSSEHSQVVSQGKYLQVGSKKVKSNASISRPSLVALIALLIVCTYA